jgi:hypothetical protein
MTRIFVVRKQQILSRPIRGRAFICEQQILGFVVKIRLIPRLVLTKKGFVVKDSRHSLPTLS